MIKQTQAGAQVITQHELRGGIVTANATVTTGTATALIVGDADYFLDIVEIQFSTGSSVALATATFGIDLINDGTVVRHYDMVDSGTIQFVHDLPLKQITKGTPWNLDMDDVTGTTVSVSATLIKKNKLT